MDLGTLIELTGWGYFLAWSLSFYGQLLLNFRLKSIEGVSLDFLFINVTGYIFYSVFCIYGYIWPQSGATGKVFLNDVIFATHALFINLLMVWQLTLYGRGNRKVNPVTKAFLLTMWSFVLVYASLSTISKVVVPTPKLSVISFLGYFKLITTMLKYWPQMMWNFKRQSTRGWSTFNVLLDFTGGFLCLLQIWLYHQWNAQIALNPVKLILSVISMTYDVVFMIQIYCLYPNTEDQKETSKIQHFSDDFRTPNNLKLNQGVEPLPS